MFSLSPYLVFPAIGFAACLVLTKIFIWALPALGFMDTPGDRKIHVKAIPRGGGLAIVLAFFASWTALTLYRNEGMALLMQILLPAIVLTLIGLADDRVGLKPIVKLGGQFLVAGIVWSLGVRFHSIDGIELANWLSFLLTCLWIVGFINAFNLIDGMDGLATGLCTVASLCLFVCFLSFNLIFNAQTMLILAAVCIGFLRYNYHPAKIFLGDTGSMFLGYMVAVAGIVSCAKAETLYAVMVPILAGGIPVFDTFLAIWRRFGKKLLSSFGVGSGASSSEIMAGDAEHLHHRIYKSNGSQSKTTLILYGLAISLSLCGVVLLLAKNAMKSVAFALMLIAFVAAIRYLASVELWNSAKVIMLRAKIFHKRFFIGFCHPFIDVFLLLAIYGLSKWLLSGSLEGNFDWLDMFISILVTISTLLAGGIYKRFWPRASIFDYARLLWLLCFGNLLCVAVNILMHHGAIDRESLAKWTLCFILSIIFVMGHRILLRVFKMYMIGVAYRSRLRSGGTGNVFIYGAGLKCQLFLTVVMNNDNLTPMKIIGLIDDDTVLSGLFVYGVKVYGTFDDIEAIYEETKFNHLVVTLELPPARLRELKDFCKQRSIRLSCFDYKEHALGNA